MGIRFRRKEAEREREKMRIFLALLLTLLIADTITGASTRRRKSKSKSKTKRKSSSSSGKLLKSLSKKLDDLAQAEESRDNAIEDKMDQAVEDLTNSVKNMHANLNEFINTDTAVSSRLKNQVKDMSDQVSRLSETVTGAIKKVKELLMPRLSQIMTRCHIILTTMTAAMMTMTWNPWRKLFQKE